MTEKFLYFIEEEININTKKKFFIKASDTYTLSLYKLDDEDYQFYEELGSDDYTAVVYLDVNRDVMEKALDKDSKLITDTVASVYLINLPREFNSNDTNLEDLLKLFFLYAFENNDFLFDNFLSIVEENGWYSSKEEAKNIYIENKKFFDELDKIILEDNFLEKYVNKENFFTIEY